MYSCKKGRLIVSESICNLFRLIVVLVVLFMGIKNVHAQCAAGTYNNAAWQICYQGNSTSTSYSLGTIAAGQYARLAVVKGFQYRFSTCGAGFDSQLTIKDDADNNLVYNDDNGPDCTANTASVDWTATYTGFVRVNLHVYPCTNGNSATVNVKVVGGSNTQDDQNAYGNGNWIGHVYDASTAGSFTTYTGYYTESENFNQSFSSCIQLYSNGQPNVQMNENTFTVRYRMLKNYSCGMYTFTVGSDDGVRLWANGVLILDKWIDRGYTTNNSTTVYLSGPTYMVMEYYNGVGGHQASISSSVVALPLAGTVAKIDPTTCGGNGTINVSPTYGTGSAALLYNDDFASSTPAVGSGTKFGNASLTAGYLQLTPEANSQQGTLVVSNPNSYNSGQIRTEFDLYMGGGAGPADGFSVSYADDIAGTPSGSEDGLGSKLQIRFKTYSGAGGACPQAISVWYAGTQIGSCYGANSIWRNAWVHVTIAINASNQISLTVGSNNYLINGALPAGYGAADKSSWKWAFSARTGGADDNHWIDNLVITNYGQFEYSVDGTNWQNSTSFTKPAGTYTVYMRNKGNNGCQTSIGSTTLSDPAKPAAPSSGGNVTVCTGNSGTLSATPPSGSTVDWYSSTPALLSSGSNTYATTTAGTYSAYSRNTTTTCVSATSTPITLTLTPNNTAGSASSTPTLCISTALTAITHTTTGATGISNAGVSGANGLPAGVSAAWASNTITISGTPTASGTFNYSIPLTGGCGSVNATGTIIVSNTPTTAGAGLDQANCNNGSFTLAGNVPVVGIGTWSLVAGSATITSTSVNNTSVTGVPSGSSTTLRWTIANGACTSSFDDIVLTNNSSASIPSAGGNQEACYRTPVPNLSVAVSAGETADWYDAASGGTLVKTGSLTFNEAIDGSGPNPIPGTYTYYAEGRNTTTNCLSTSRVAVTLTIRAVPVISPTATPNTSCAGDNVSLAANATAGSGSITGYSWSSGLGNVASGTVTPTTTISYTVTVQNSYSCTNDASTTVTIKTAASYVMLPSSTVTTLIEQCTDGGWTYYANSSTPDDWTFAIRKNGNTFTAQVDITVAGGTIDHINTTKTGYEHGSYLMKRYWDVSVTSGSISTSVDVKFFYDPSEKTAAESARDAAWTPYSATASKTPFRWFKTVGSTFGSVISSIDGNSFNNFSNITLTESASGTENGVTFAQFNGITSFSGGTGGYGFSSPGTGLPVKLIDFTATAIENSYIRLDWSTALEINNAGFEIERSTNGADFAKIGWVKGNDNSTSTIAYSFDDKTAQPNIRYYYRLKQIDNGNVAFEYSNIVSAMFINEGKTAVGDF
ncbi:MAG: hypothetical protein JNL95_07200, partial [Chitinophagales bacterium]|nr:hypothetical protein [Chitinophagales bacterium]